MNSNEERIQMIREAMELVREAQGLVDDAVSGDCGTTRLEANYEAYGRYGFNQLLGNGNPYDSSLDSLIEEIEKEI